MAPVASSWRPCQPAAAYDRSSGACARSATATEEVVSARPTLSGRTAATAAVRAWCTDRDNGDNIARCLSRAVPGSDSPGDERCRRGCADVVRTPTLQTSTDMEPLAQRRHSDFRPGSVDSRLRDSAGVAPASPALNMY